MGVGPAPADPTTRRRRNKPVRGEWKTQAASGWQHGKPPVPPMALTDYTHNIWDAWMRGWFAANWTPDDLPGLYITIELYDQCHLAFLEPIVQKGTNGRGEPIYAPRPNPTTELRQYMDNYGITPKGQQDRRWKRPDNVEQPATKDDDGPDIYGHLRAVK